MHRAGRGSPVLARPGAPRASFFRARSGSRALPLLFSARLPSLAQSPPPRPPGKPAALCSLSPPGFRSCRAGDVSRGPQWASGGCDPLQLHATCGPPRCFRQPEAPGPSQGLSVHLRAVSTGPAPGAHKTEANLVFRSRCSLDPPAPGGAPSSRDRAPRSAPQFPVLSLIRPRLSL